MKQEKEKGGGQARPLPSGGHGVVLNGGRVGTDSGQLDELGLSHAQ
jgi:hypothetical protein